jgi:hypothetical protein
MIVTCARSLVHLHVFAERRDLGQRQFFDQRRVRDQAVHLLGEGARRSERAHAARFESLGIQSIGFLKHGFLPLRSARRPGDWQAVTRGLFQIAQGPLHHLRQRIVAQRCQRVGATRRILAWLAAMLRKK